MLIYMSRHERLLSIGIIGRLFKGIPEILLDQAIRVGIIPSFSQTLTTASFNSNPRVLPKYDSLVIKQPDGSAKLDSYVSSKRMSEAIAYLCSLDLQNIRDGVYPVPYELRKASTVPLQDGLKTISGLVKGLNMYLGAPDYTREMTASAKLKQYSENLDLPEYYMHDYHSVPGGFLNPEHAACYDTLSEVVFAGMHRTARRMCLRPIWEFLKGKDASQLRLLDIATGTGSFLLQIHEAFPNLRLSGLDLSPAMISFAKETTSNLPIDFYVANMLEIPEGDSSLDIVTQTNSFHELPLNAIEKVAKEIARTLKADGIYVHLDASQIADDPASASLSPVGFDGQFVEPYMKSWLHDTDLDKIMKQAGLMPVQPPKPLFASTVRCYRKVGDI